MKIPPLTDNQATACDDPSRLLLIEAGPGTGKTRTVAERFGTLAHVGARQGVAVLSFTTAATTLLRQRILFRWGRSALAWPNRFRTLDSEFRSLLEYLLRAEEVRWPNDHKSLIVIDDWENRHKVVYPSTRSWVPSLSGRTVVPQGRSTPAGELVVTARKRLAPQIEAARCTHASVRDLVLQAAAQPEIRQLVLNYIASTTSAVIVDEAFDANDSDAELLGLFAEAGCHITLVGDPWQAIYGFREADPQILRESVVDHLKFRVIELTESFRFQDPQTHALSAKLRSGQSCSLPPIAKPDVVLAPEWRMLWDEDDWILPSAFGQVQSRIGAALSLLLDHFMRGQSLGQARLTANACDLLGIEESHYRENSDLAFRPVVQILKASGPAGSSEALDLVQLNAKTVLGTKRKPTIRQDQRARYERSLENLARRLSHVGNFTPGLTVHQAKGDEWNRVAIVLTEADIAALETGLSPRTHEHRRLYVALTRARLQVGHV